MGVVKNYSCGVELLRETSGTSETQPLPLCTRSDPCESKIGNKMVVVVETTDIAMAAGEEHFDDLAFVALERKVVRQSTPAILPARYEPKCVPSPGSR